MARQQDRFAAQKGRTFKVSGRLITLPASSPYTADQLRRQAEALAPVASFMRRKGGRLGGGSPAMLAAIEALGQ